MIMSGSLVVIDRIIINPCFWVGPVFVCNTFLLGFTLWRFGQYGARDDDVYNTKNFPKRSLGEIFIVNPYEADYLRLSTGTNSRCVSPV